MTDPQTTLAPLRILIADDNAATRAATIALLHTAPHGRSLDIVQADNGRDAVDLAREFRPDVALLDVQMPVLDGIAAARRIKQQRPSTRVVVLTMHGAYREAAVAAGADAFLLKGSAAGGLLTAVFG